MLEATLNELAEFPARLQRMYHAVPPTHRNWAPASWDGVPSEQFTALEQICHVRDIEIDGYHVRLQRMLETESPRLESIDSYEVAEQKRYGKEDPQGVLVAIRAAREHTLQMIRPLNEAQLARTGEFEGYGTLTVKSLIHYLCSHDQQHLSGLQWLLGKIDADQRIGARFD
jgi:hypothetical protein